MNLELLMKFFFKASHSLVGNETPHEHTWRLEVTLLGQPLKGKIIDIVEARQLITQEFAPLVGTYLNDESYLTEQARRAPTCEALAEYFWHKLISLIDHSFKAHNPNIELKSVAIAICDDGQPELGMSTFYKSP